MNGLDEAARQFFAWIGYEPNEWTFSPVIESEADGRLYVKFMSNRGVTDDDQAARFAQFLDEEGAEYERLSRRSFHTTAATGQRILEVLDASPASA